MSPEMNLVDQIKQTCRTPQEAILLLAEAIDGVRELVAALPSSHPDPWEQPLEWGDVAADVCVDYSVEAADQRARVEGNEVIVPPASEERMEGRRRFAHAVQLWEFLAPMDEETTLDAFAKGGPLWLYHSNRDAAMQLPYEARQWLCADIAKDSPEEAAEISRDILKASESVDMGSAIESFQRMVDAGGSYD